MGAVLQHIVASLVLTALLAYQARALAAVLRSRRALAVGRRPRITDLVWVAIPVAVVLLRAVRSWFVALDLGSPAMAGVGPIEAHPPP